MKRRTDDVGKDLVGSASMIPLPGVLATGKGTCQICGTPVHAESKVVRCPGCDAPHHQDCWNYNNQQCAIFGCRMGNASTGARRPPATVPGKPHIVPPDFRPAPVPGAMGTVARVVGTLLMIAVLIPSSGTKRRAGYVDTGGWDHQKIDHMLQWGDGEPRVQACRLLGTLPAWNDHDWYWIQNAAQQSGYPEVRMQALRTLAASKQRPELCLSIVRGATEDKDVQVAQLANQLLAGR